MDQILDSPERTEQNFEYAGFWIRFVAYFIDAILLGIVQVFLGYVFFDDYNLEEGNLGLSLLSLVIGVGYFAGMESSARQATLGKMALGIKVGDVRGEQLSFGNALGRYFAKIISGIILLIGFMMAGWDPKKQALHDKLADTYVFYGR